MNSDIEELIFQARTMIESYADNQSIPQLGLQAIGVLLILVIALQALSFVYTHFLKPSGLQKYLIDTKNAKLSKSKLRETSSETKSWALVTGASDGIGKELADELAKSGFNVVIHGRNPTKLDGVLKGLQAGNPGTHFRVLVADASSSTAMHADVERMAAFLNALPGPLTLINNNAGGTSPSPRVYVPLRELQHEHIEGLIALNARFAVQLTRALLPGLLERYKTLGAPATVLNTGSVAGAIGVPQQSVYGGSKAFLRAFTCALARELRMDGYAGVTAMYLVVGRVTFAGPWATSPSLFFPSARTLAKSLLGKVGCGELEATPYWGHAVQVAIVNSLPEWLITRIVTDEIKKDLEDEERMARWKKDA